MDTTQNTESKEELTKGVFSKQVETVVVTSRGAISFIDAIVSLADIYGIDVTDCTKYLTPDIIGRIKDDVISSNKIRKAAQKELFQSNGDDRSMNTMSLHDFWL